MITTADVQRNERRVALAFAREQRALAQRVSDIMDARIAGREVLDPLTHELIRMDLNRVFDEWYGLFPGDRRARFRQLIVEQSARSKRVGPRDALAMVRRLVPPSVMRAIEREAA